MGLPSLRGREQTTFSRRYVTPAWPLCCGKGEPHREEAGPAVHHAAGRLLHPLGSVEPSFLIYHISREKKGLACPEVAGSNLGGGEDILLLSSAETWNIFSTTSSAGGGRINQGCKTCGALSAPGGSWMLSAEPGTSRTSCQRWTPIS